MVARCKNGKYAPFITEQVDALKQLGVVCRYFGINKKGIWGYLKHIRGFQHAIQDFRPDVIHAHYGLSGLFANAQRKIPVVTTYHGTDINDKRLLRLSKWSIRFSAFNVFVSPEIVRLAKPPHDRYALVPCGINLNDYPQMDKNQARESLGWESNRHFILFSGAFDNPIKNAPLAQSAVNHLENTSLVELKGYSRSQVAKLMNAADALIMTSFSEGSPQVIKEALACGCPIVSVDVGDVAEVISDIDGCYLAQRDPQDIASKLKQALSKKNRTSGRDRILEKGLDNQIIARKILSVYERILDIRKRI